MHPSKTSKMANDELEIEKCKKKKKKRSLDDNQIQNRDRVEALPSFKKIHVDLTDLAPSSSSSNDSSSTIDEAGVFDFPWMKEGEMMKSGFKFDDDTFASSLDATNGESSIFGEDDRLIVTGKCGWQGITEARGRYDRVNKCRKDQKEVVSYDGDDGLECVWDSLLNQQPLSNIEFEAGGF